MTGILTIPERLAQIAYDASTEVVTVAHIFQATIDSAERPAVLVEVADADYQQDGAGRTQHTENYNLLLFGDLYEGVQMDAGEKELKVRRIADAIVTYLLASSQLQMIDQRGAVGQRLGAVPGVMWINVRRGMAGAMTKGEQPFWGCEINVTVNMTVPLNRRV